MACSRHSMDLFVALDAGFIMGQMKHDPVEETDAPRDDMMIASNLPHQAVAWADERGHALESSITRAVDDADERGHALESSITSAVDVLSEDVVDRVPPRGFAFRVKTNPLSEKGRSALQARGLVAPGEWIHDKVHPSFSSSRSRSLCRWGCEGCDQSLQGNG